MKQNDKAKIEKELPEFVSEVLGLSVENLDCRLASLSKQLEEVRQSMQDNEAILAAREELNLLSAPFKDAKKFIQLKTQYIIDLIKEKGGQ
jgi:hypothetical protein